MKNNNPAPHASCKTQLLPFRRVRWTSIRCRSHNVALMSIEQKIQLGGSYEMTLNTACACMKLPIVRFRASWLSSV